MNKLVVLTALAILAVCPMALAEPFEHPPETYAPQWVTNFPYQRNIDWTFDVNPLGGPSHNGAPGAHYEGYDDPLLWESDYVLFCGAVDWYAELPDLPASGVMAVDNRQGNAAATAAMAVHVDNWEVPRLVKNVWIEADFLLGPDPEQIELNMQWILPPGAPELVGSWESDPWQLPNGLWRRNFWAQITPNPIWETLCLELRVQPGNFFLLDRLHIATECVPEPGMFPLLGIGLGAVALLRARRRR